MMHQCTLSNHANKPTFESKWDEIYGICLRKACRWHNHPVYQTSHDLAQIAAIKVWKAFDQYDWERPLAAFVNTIAFNAFVDACRSNEVVYEVSFDELRPAVSLKDEMTCSIVKDSAEDISESNPIYSIAGESSSIALDLEPLLSYLSWRQRLVIEMSFGLGDCLWERTDESIAEKLGVTRQTVISDRKKAIEEMRIRVGIRTPRVMAA